MFVATRYATHKRSSSNVVNSIRLNGVYFTVEGFSMDQGHFYYIDDQYFIDFPDMSLMQNKENINGQLHGRPCFYSFQEKSTGIYWMIPISSQVTKYQRHYQAKMKKYHVCDTIVFGNVLGHKKAFLIQNMCPVIPSYIKSEYIDRISKVPVQVDGVLEKELLTKAKKVLALHRQGKHLIFPDVLHIESVLLKQMSANII